MQKSTTQKLASFYHHIDNGGISLHLSTEVFENKGESFDVPRLSIDATYHGYPAVSASLSGAELTPEVLREMAKTMSEAAAKLEEIRKNRPLE